MTGGVFVDHEEAKVVATDMANDSVHVLVRHGKELYFRVVDRDSTRSTVVILSSEQTQELLEGIAVVLRSQAP